MCLIITTVIGTSCHRQKKEVLTDDNPFFQEWDTPYGVPPFDKIQKSHYLPAFERGIQEQREAIQAICDNTEEPTFGNTIIPYEYSGELLNKVAGVFLNLTECCNDDVRPGIFFRLQSLTGQVPKLNQNCIPIHLR